MKTNWFRLLLACVLLLGAGCSLVELPDSSGSYHANGPYWDGPVQNFTSVHVLGYLQQLRTLSDSAIDDEMRRVKKAHASYNRPVDQIQHLLVLIASDTYQANSQIMKGIIVELNENTSFIRTDVQELLFLLKTIVSSKVASQLHSSSGDKICRQLQSANAELNEALKACNDEAKTLAGQIQKLRDIERILNNRELSTEN